MTYLTFVAVILSYLVGSFSSAIMTCKLLGLPDPRTQGSQNPGATNVLRYGGKTAALLTFAGDALKGALPVIIARYFWFNNLSLMLIALAAFVGHLYPVYFRFRGGKGVATMIGCLLALSWQAGLAFVGTWLLVAIVFRYSSLAALIAAILAPFYTYYFTFETFATGVAIMSLLLIYRHKQNILNLWHGKEDKIGKKKKV